MFPPVTQPPGRGTLAAIGLLACLITSLASPLVKDLRAQIALEFDEQPTDTEAGQIMPDVVVHAPGAILPVTVTLSIASGPGGLDGTVAQQTVLETATFSDLNIDEAGTYTLLATADNFTAATSASFQITPGPPDPEESEITVDPTSIPADGVSSALITVLLRDEFGNPLTTGGADVVLSTTFGSLGTVDDGGDGTYTATLTSTATGTATVTAAVDNLVLDDDATVTFTVAPATQLAFAQQPTSRAAGQTITPAVTVEARNAGGNVDPDFTGLVTLSIATGPAGGALMGTTSKAAVDGVATFGDLSIQQAGTYTLQAASAPLTEATSSSFQITPAAPSGATSEITADPTTIPADGSSTSTITVQLRDAFGNPLTGGGADVSLSTTSGTLGPDIDNGDGTYTATLTSATTAGTATISGTVNGADITDTASVTFALVGQPTLVVDEQPTDTPVDEPITPPVVVRVVDGLGNTLTGFTGNVAATLAVNPAGADLQGDVNEPLLNGVATFDDLRIDRSAGGYRLGFSVSGAAGATSATFAVTAGAASPATSTISANPVSILADGASTSSIVVQLRDAEGVLLSTGGDNVNLSTTLGSLGAVRDNGDGTYTATLLSTIAPGTATISGTVNGASISDTATVTFAAGSADLEVVVEVSDETPGIGDQVVYVVTAGNQGPDHATGVEITQTLPARLEFVSATTSQGEYVSTTGIWSVGALAEGERATLTIVTRVLGPDTD